MAVLFSVRKENGAITAEQDKEVPDMNEWDRLHRQTQRYKETYPPGTRIMLLGMRNDPNPVKAHKIADSDIVHTGDHVEIRLKGADLKGTGFGDDRVTGSILHFWGKFFTFEKGSDVLGVAASYTVWVKEPEWSGCLTADIGADIRGADGYCQQAFTGNNRVITNEPRVVFGHNVGPKAYDTVMDSDTVCKLLGIE